MQHQDVFATNRGRNPLVPVLAFQNPDTCPAGKLIEKSLRSHGQARFDVHGNFIVNLRSHSGRFSVIDLIQKRAREERGLELEVEVQILGQ